MENLAVASLEPFWPKPVLRFMSTKVCQLHVERDKHQRTVIILINFLPEFFFPACFWVSGFSLFFLFFCLPSLNYANVLDVWSCLRHSVLLVVLLRYWVPLQWMHTTVHSTKSLPKGWKEFKALKRQKGLSWGFFYVHWKKRIKYKFPIGACYGSGTHIKALCYDIKAAWGFLGVFFPAHHMQRRTENNLKVLIL